MFDEGGNKIFENKWCIGKRIEKIKSFWRIVSIALILILIDIDGELTKALEWGK